MNSFRLRIALANAAVSGLLLLSLAIASLVILYNLKVSELREDISDFSRLEIPALHHALEYQKFGYILDNDRRKSGETHLSWLLVGRQNDIIYKSESWPETISSENIPVNEAAPEPSRGFPMAPPPGEGQGNSRLPWSTDDVSSRPVFGPQVPPKQTGPRPGRAQFRQVDFETIGPRLTGQLLGVFQSPRFTLAVSAELTPVFEEVKSIAYAFLLSLPFALVLLSVTSYWLSGKAIKPIQDLTQATESIDAQSLQERVYLRNADREFTRLAHVFNDMLERLQKSFDQAKRFSSDAAHELKTPLAVLQGELDLAMQDCEEGSDLQQKLSSLSAEILNLSQIVSKLLYLSQADAGKLLVSRERFNYSNFVEDIVDDAQLTAPELNLIPQLDRNLFIDADPLLVGQIVHNLISNAIRYNRKDGSITISLHPKVDFVNLDISNTGEPIPKESEARIFERFYRAAPGKAEGTGLGLSLALEFARAHNGNLSLLENKLDHIAFQLSLPMQRDISG